MNLAEQQSVFVRPLVGIFPVFAKIAGYADAIPAPLCLGGFA
jgi:hypothetical protein